MPGIKIFIKNEDNTFTDPYTKDIFKLNEPKTTETEVYKICSTIHGVVRQICDLTEKCIILALYVDFEPETTPNIIPNIIPCKTITIIGYVDGTLFDREETKYIISNGIFKSIKNNDFEYIFDEEGRLEDKNINTTFYKVFNYFPGNKDCNIRLITTNTTTDIQDNVIIVKSEIKKQIVTNSLCFDINSKDEKEQEEMKIFIEPEAIFQTPEDAIKKCAYNKNGICFVMKVICTTPALMTFGNNIRDRYYFGDYIFDEVLDFNSYRKLNININKANFEKFYNNNYHLAVTLPLLMAKSKHLNEIILLFGRVF